VHVQRWALDRDAIQDRGDRSALPQSPPEAGSRKLEAGWPLHAVSRWLGHTKLTTTDTYLNATTQLLHELNERKPLALVR
jgi:integrase